MVISSFDLEINGVPKPMRAGSLEISKTINGRTTARFSIISQDRSYRPPMNATVTIDVDSVRLFGGVITNPREQGLLGGVKRPIVTIVSAADFNVYADRRFIKEIIPAGSLKAALQVIEPYLAIYGITLDPGQVDGPTLPDLEYDYVRCSDVLSEFSTITAQFGPQFLWQIDENKVLRMYQPADIAAPFDLIGDGSLGETNDAVEEVIGDITVEKTRETHANRVIVKVPKKTEIDRLERFESNGTQDEFQLDFTLKSFPYGVIRRYFTDSGLPSGGHTFGREGTVDGGGNPVQFWYVEETNSIVSNIGNTEDGFTYEIQFNGEKEEIGIAQDDASIAADGLTEKVVQVENVPSGQTAQSLAEGYLAQSLPIHHAIRYRTLLPGLTPGQLQTVNVSARALNSDVIITDVVIREFGHKRLVYSVAATLVGDTSLNKGMRDLYKVWRGDLTGRGGASTTVSTPPPVVGASGPALPFRSNQFNDGGVFGGHDGWLFYKEFMTATLGLEHTAGGSSNLLVGEGHTVI